MRLNPTLPDAPRQKDQRGAGSSPRSYTAGG